MPPVASSVGLMLAMAGSVGLAAQTNAPTGTAGPSSLTQAGSSAQPSLSELSSRLLAATGSSSGQVKPVHYAVPSPLPASENSPESDQADRPPRHRGRQPQVDQAGPHSRSPPDGHIRTPLAPRGRSKRGAAQGGVARAGSLASVITMASSLAVVLGLFLVVAWAMRRTVPGGSVVLPGEVVEVLGRAALAGRAQVYLVRCGNKLLLVSLSPTGMETLTEITDPVEVDRLAGLCRQAHPTSATAAFRQVFQQFAPQRTEPGLAGASGDDVRLANAGIAGTRAGTLEGHDV